VGWNLCLRYFRLFFFYFSCHQLKQKNEELKEQVAALERELGIKSETQSEVQEVSPLLFSLFLLPESNSNFPTPAHQFAVDPHLLSAAAQVLSS